MDHRNPPREHTLALFADPVSAKPILKGILHTIFFHRYFRSIRPSNVEILDLTLPFIDDIELETLIDTRATSLIRQLSSSSTGNGNTRGGLSVQFFEKKRRKGGLWFGGLGGKGEEEVCWESWWVEVTLAQPRSENGKFGERGGRRCGELQPFVMHIRIHANVYSCPERIKVRKAMEVALQKTAMKIVTVVNRDKDHIPPITTSETNPFPYQIVLSSKGDGRPNRVGLY